MNNIGKIFQITQGIIWKSFFKNFILFIFGGNKLNMIGDDTD